MNPRIICFGESLWDMLPAGKQAGGAPMNVAVHLNNFEVEATLISKIGKDDLGAELLEYIKSKELDTRHIQRSKNHLTGIVKVNLDDKNEASYDLVRPVAWDFIRTQPVLLSLVKTAEYFVFGSLAARSPTTFNTLKKLLKAAPFKVFDVNLRAPHFSQKVIKFLLQETDLVKMNRHELDQIAAWFTDKKEERDQIIALSERFNLAAVCVTKGEDGAVLYYDQQFYESDGFPVRVVDTIGSGDSFLAALLKGMIGRQAPQDFLDFACATGAYLATQAGATPVISEKGIYQWINQQTSDSLPPAVLVLSPGIIKTN